MGDITILRRQLSQVLDPHQKMSGWGFIVDLTLAIIIILNTVAYILESIEVLYSSYSELFRIVEVFSVIIFTVEYLARLWSAPDRDDLSGATATAKRFRYVISFMGLVDFLVLIPFWLRWFVPILDLRWLRILRLFWFFKLSHFTPAMDLVAKAVYKERQALLSTLYLLVLVITMSGTLVYLAEKNAPHEALDSIPDAMYWSIMTMTPGSSDAIPVTFLGHLVGIITALLGVCTFALLTGILSTSFYHELQLRKQMLNTHIQSCVADGVINENERILVEKLRQELDLSGKQTKEMIRLFAQIHTEKKQNTS